MLKKRKIYSSIKTKLFNKKKTVYYKDSTERKFNKHSVIL